MDDNYIVNRIVNILNSESQNLVKGNISSPRPGSICQVSTDYGIKEAYNINCTYPGDAYVIWDKDEECYYCFTDKPSEVISSRQLSYRKYKEVKKKVNEYKYILVMDSNLYITNGLLPIDNNNTNIFWENALKRLNPYYKKVYLAKGDGNNQFFGGIIDKEIKTYYDPLWKHLTDKGVEIIEVLDTELDRIDSIFWMPFYQVNSQSIIGFTETRITQLKKIANTTGIVLQSEWSGWGPLTALYLDKFYNPYNPLKIDITTYDYSYSWAKLYSNISPNKNIRINSNATGTIPIELLKEKNILAYCIKYTKTINLPNSEYILDESTLVANSKRASVIVW